MYAHATRGEIKGSIIISLLGTIAVTIILVLLLNMLPELQLTKDSDLYFALMLMLIAFLELFMLAFIGNIIEYFRKEPELITLSIPAIIAVLLARELELFQNNVKTALTLGIILGVALYTLIARE